MRKLTPFFLLLVICCYWHCPLEGKPQAKKKAKTETLALAAIFRDEAPYLKEWIEYHKIVGVSKFFLYNNLSTDHYLEVLLPYIKTGEVELTDWGKDYARGDYAHWIQIQVSAYQDALVKVRKMGFKWLAVIDADEFIVPVHHANLIEFLQEQCKSPHIGGVCGRWVFFGTSNVPKIPPDKTMIETLIKNEGERARKDDGFTWNSGCFKTIGRVEKIAHIVSPHYFLYVTDAGHYLESFDHLQINHYWTHDEDYFNNKKIPSRLERGHPKPLLGSKNAAFEPFGQPILRFVPALRERLGMTN